MQEQALTELVIGLMPYFLAVVLGLILVVVVGTLLIVKWRVPLVIGAAGIGWTGLGGLVCAAYLISSASGQGSVEAITTLKLATLVSFAAWFGVSGIGFVGLSLLAVAGARRGPRQLKWAGVTAALVAATVLSTVLGGVFNAEYGSEGFYFIRAFEYVGLGALVCVAMLCGGDEEGNGYEAGAAAASSFVMVVAVCEAATQGLNRFMLLAQIPNEPVERRATIVTDYLGLVQGDVLWGGIILALASLVGLVGVVALARARASAANLAGVGWIGVAWLVWMFSNPSSEAIVAAVSSGS